ncbi:MAG TPA: hypothetical protein VLD86_01820, partial [Ilumatobacteraceae bacterium]|nr:hypothetical protein [Ilumatobacteraceae bacterium]
MSIWDAPSVDWAMGDGLLARQLFERAYPDDASIRSLLEAVGLRIGHDAPGPAGPSWTQILEAAATNGQMLDLAAELLGDAQRSWFANPLTELLGDQLPLANARRIRRHGLPL